MTAAGHRIVCDFAVVDLGIEPDIPGVAVAQDNGILADELCRASAPEVYVAGDVAPLGQQFFDGAVREPIA